MLKGIKEYKDFTLRSNFLDLAVGVIIAGALGKIVTSFVNDILLPPVGLLLGQVNLKDLYIVIKGSVAAGTPLAEAQAQAGVITWNYGSFLNSVVDFLIIALGVFLIIRTLNRMRKLSPVSYPTTKPCPHCAMDIPIKATRCPHCTSHL